MLLRSSACAGEELLEAGVVSKRRELGIGADLDCSIASLDGSGEGAKGVGAAGCFRLARRPRQRIPEIDVEPVVARCQRDGLFEGVRSPGEVAEQVLARPEIRVGEGAGLDLDRFFQRLDRVFEASLANLNGAKAVVEAVDAWVQFDRPLVLPRRLRVLVLVEEEAREVLVAGPPRGAHFDEMLPSGSGSGGIPRALKRRGKCCDGLSIVGVLLQDLPEDRHRLRRPARRSAAALARSARVTSLE